ncbi:MAG TPA: TetR/AcrR family transcriptional regulator [Burkholderiales bacterium]
MSTYHHGNLPKAILASAGKILEKEGLTGLSLRHAARRAGVSHNAPYRHFPHRESLLAGLAAQGFAMLGEALNNCSGKAMGAAYVRFALRYPERFRLMFGGSLPIEKYPVLREAAQRAFQPVVDSFRPHASPQQAQIAAAAAWSLVHGLSHLLLDGHFKQASSEAGGTEQLVRQVLDTVRYVLGAQRSA